jgi:hypothetical protein
MDLMNLALKFKDYEWAKEIYKQNESLETNGIDIDSENKIQSNYEETIALEDIYTQYAVREKDGLRSFNINSEFDRNSSELAILENPPYKKGQKVNFFIPSKEDLIFIRGTFNGYLIGLDEAYRNLNKQILNYFSSIEEKENADESNVKKQVKPRKGKSKPSEET